MAIKKFTVELLDASGKGVPDVTVKATGCSELSTSPAGTVFFLAEDPVIAVIISGKEVFSTPIDAIPDRLVFVQEGDGWKKK